MDAIPKYSQQCAILFMIVIVNMYIYNPFQRGIFLKKKKKGKANLYNTSAKNEIALTSDLSNQEYPLKMERDIFPGFY
jgi:hypothetical protein